MPNLPGKVNLQNDVISVIDKKIFMLVEGKDEVEFFSELFKNNNDLKGKELNEHIQIENGSGVSKFNKTIKALQLRTGFDNIDTLIVIRDGDGNEKSSFDSVCNAMKCVGLPVPEEINSFSVEVNGIKAGVFILPGRTLEGNMLEDLCLEIVANQTIKKHVDDYVSRICEDGNIENPKNIAKAKIQIFLASNKNIVNCIGLGAKKHYFDLNSDSLAELVDYFNQIQISV